MPRYDEFRFWSPLLGCDAARSSMVGKGTQEYFAITGGPTSGQLCRDTLSASGSLIACY